MAFSRDCGDTEEGQKAGDFEAEGRLLPQPLPDISIPTTCP